MQMIGPYDERVDRGRMVFACRGDRLAQDRDVVDEPGSAADPAG
jgi:hypothetical protein